MLLQGWSSQTPTLGWEAKPRVPARLLMEQANPMAGLSTPEPGTGSGRPGAEREAQQGLKGHFHLTVVERQATFPWTPPPSSRFLQEPQRASPQSSLSLGSRAPPPSCSPKAAKTSPGSGGTGGSHQDAPGAETEHSRTEHRQQHQLPPVWSSVVTGLRDFPSCCRVLCS